MKYKVSQLPMLENIENIFFIGIKGVGNAPLALIAHEAGVNVAGSDIFEEFITDKALLASGIKIFKDFNQNDIHDFFNGKDIKSSLVITTGAHSGFDNPQSLWAKENGFNVVTQGQALGIFMEGDIFDKSFKGIAVAASHGKTTITSLLATTLKELDEDPTYAAGTGQLFPMGAPGHYGTGEYFVAEADEYASEPVYDRVPKFLYLNPKYAIFNNIDFDHPDFFESIDDVKKAFFELSNNIKSGGLLLANGDDVNLKNIKDEVEKDIRVILYGEGSKNDYVISKIVTSGLESKFTVSKKGNEIGVFELLLPGVHNAKNALSVIALLVELGYEVPKIRAALKTFKGTKRRLEKLGATSSGALVFDDYAHHPDEIKATLKALKDAYTDKKIISIFQPHTFSRTKALLADFVNSFEDSESLFLLPVFKSRRDVEKDLVSSETVIEEFEKNGKTTFFNKFEDVVEYVGENFNSEEYVLVTLGAGDVYKIAQKVLEK